MHGSGFVMVEWWSDGASSSPRSILFYYILLYSTLLYSTLLVSQRRYCTDSSIHKTTDHQATRTGQIRTTISCMKKFRATRKSTHGQYGIQARGRLDFSTRLDLPATVHVPRTTCLMERTQPVKPTSQANQSSQPPTCPPTSPTHQLTNSPTH